MRELHPENVKEDSRLSQAEKETNIWFNKESDTMRVFTREGGIMRRLLQHPLFTVIDYNEYDGNIVGLRGEFPIDALSFGSKERKHGGHASIITNGVMNDEENAEIAL